VVVVQPATPLGYAAWLVQELVALRG